VFSFTHCQKNSCSAEKASLILRKMHLLGFLQAAARENALMEENAKLKYQILHLKRAAALQ